MWLIGLLSGLVSAVLHHIGEYRQHWWWDNAAHFAAGVSLGAAVRLLPRQRSPRRTAIIASLVAAIWELFEYRQAMWPYKHPDVDSDRVAEDTILDTVVVAAGAALAAWLDQDSDSEPDS